MAKKLLQYRGTGREAWWRMIHNKIYLLEDDPDIRTIVNFILLKEGYNVEAFEKIGDLNDRLLRGGTPALFLMDVSLPDGNGLELCKKLVSDRKYASIPVLIMSAGVCTEEKARAVGATYFINKPFEMKYFLKKVNDLVPLSEHHEPG